MTAGRPAADDAGAMRTAAPPRAETAISGLEPASIAWATWMPLGQRLRRGEGLLVALNASLAAIDHPGAAVLAARVGVSVATMLCLYFLNDVVDAHRDLHDPGKDQRFVAFCARHRPRLAWILAAEHAATLALALALLGPASAAAVLAVFAVNLAYSMSIKGRPALDVAWVALWGATYAMVTAVPVPPAVFAAVGLMTGVAHVFQITRDRDVDRRNEVRTSAVARPWLPTVQMSVACVALGACLGALLGPVAGASAAIPFVLYAGLPSNQSAWMLARAWFAIAWVALLRGLA